MAAASNGNPNHLLGVPDQNQDRVKAIEAKVVILGTQGNTSRCLYAFKTLKMILRDVRLVAAF